jgi:hypothetical protein
MKQSAKITAGVVATLLLLVALVYGWRSYSNGRKLQQLQAQVAEKMSQPAPPGASPWRRGPGGGFNDEIRQQVEALPASYQQQFRRSMGNMFQRNQEKRFDEYFKLSKPERQKYLDKQIADSENQRKEREARRKQREAQAPSGVASNGGPGNRPGGFGGRGGGGGQGARLDRTSPAFRAKRDEYRRDIAQRRAELGLPTNVRR